MKSSLHIGGPALPTHAAHAGVKTRVSDPEAAEVLMGQLARVGFVDEKKVLGARRLAHTGAAEVDLAAWLQCGSEQHIWQPTVWTVPAVLNTTAGESASFVGAHLLHGAFDLGAENLHFVVCPSSKRSSSGILLTGFLVRGLLLACLRLQAVLRHGVVGC